MGKLIEIIREHLQRAHLARHRSSHKGIGIARILIFPQMLGLRLSRHRKISVPNRLCKNAVSRLGNAPNTGEKALKGDQYPNSIESLALAPSK